MLRGFRFRRPWAVFLIALLATPIAGALYVGRARTGFTYLGLFVAGLTILFHLPLRFSAPHGYLFALFGLGCLAFLLAAALHLVFIVRRDTTSPPTEWYAGWPVVVVAGLVAWASPLLYSRLIHRPQNIMGVSMRPALEPGSYIVVRKLAYRSEGPKRGDVVIFVDGDLDRIGRVIGLPGETVEGIAGRIHINGQSLVYGDETATADGREFLEAGMDVRGPYRILLSTDEGNGRDFGPIQVPADEYFVMGDNRDHSMDSRHDVFGTVPRATISGQVAGVYWDARTGQYGYRPLY